MNTPKRICLIMQGGREWIGGLEYIRNIILALARLPPAERAGFEIMVLCSSALESKTLDSISPHVKKILFVEDSLEPWSFANRVQWRLQRCCGDIGNPRLNRLLIREHIDFVYPNNDAGRASMPFTSAAWLYDFQHKHLPHLFSEDEIKRRNAHFSHVARHAPRIVLSSHAAREDLLKFYQVEKERTALLQFHTVASKEWFTGDPDAVARSYHLPEKFFLVANQFWQHKNHRDVFEALGILRSRGSTPAVVCTGHPYDSRKPSHIDEMLSILHRTGIADQVHILGLIPRADQIQLLRKAVGVIQPSQFEGWNTTVEDARALGKPVICSDIPVHREQNPPRIAFFELGKPEYLADLMAQWWQEEPSGPVATDEAHAWERQTLLVEEFAREFLAISGVEPP